MLKKILFLMTLLVLIGCVDKERSYCYLEKQIIDNGRYTIYNLCLNSDFAFTDETYKTLIFDQDQPFDQNSGYELHGEIAGWISRDTLSVWRFGDPVKNATDTICRVDYENFGELTIKVLNYSGLNGGGMGEYTFSHITRDENSITFDGIKREFGPVSDSVMTYKLGNIQFKSNADTLQKISVTRISTSMDFVYHNEDGSLTENLPNVRKHSMEFTPRSQIKMNGLNLDRVFIDNRITESVPKKN